MREFYRLRTESRKPFVARILSNFLRPQVVQSNGPFVHRNGPVLHTDSTETDPFLCTTESRQRGAGAIDGAPLGAPAGLGTGMLTVPFCGMTMNWIFPDSIADLSR